MPTITIGELRRLIESSSYDKFARARHPEVRGRPQSAGVKRERSRSRSRTRSHHHRPQSADKRSRPLRPQSATVVLHYHPQKQAQTTPRKRPESAQSATCVPRHDVKKMDFSGLSNMMKSMSFSQSSTRGWKSKSVDFSESEKKAKISSEKLNKTEKPETDENQPQVDMKSLRKNRSSSFSKFKYPMTNQCLEKHRNRMYVEENIPASLRRLPKYSNQPRRMICSYTPPGNSVTKVKQHSVSSQTLPPPPPDLSRKPPLPPSKNRAPSQTDDGPPTERSDPDELQRNATYHYVHRGETEATLVLPADDDADFQTPRELSPVPPIIVTVQDTPRDSTARPDSERREKLLPDIEEAVQEKEADKQQSIASDDSFLVQDDIEDNINGNDGFGSDLEKHSFGDMNDMESLPSELSLHSPAQEKASGFKAKPYQESSDDDIEEDIPEEVNVKTISFRNQTGARSFKH